MLEQFNPEARAALESTTDYAIGLGHNYIGTEHLLLALIGAEDAAGGGPLTKRGVTRDAVEREIRSQLASHVTDAEALRAVGVDPQALHDGAQQLGVDVKIGGLTAYEPDATVPLPFSRVTARTRTVLDMAEHARADERHLRRPFGGDARRGRRSRRGRVGAARRVASGVASRSERRALATRRRDARSKCPKRRRTDDRGARDATGGSSDSRDTPRRRIGRTRRAWCRASPARRRTRCSGHLPDPASRRRRTRRTAHSLLRTPGSRRARLRRYCGPPARAQGARRRRRDG